MSVTMYEQVNSIGMKNHITLIVLLAGTSLLSAQQLHPTVLATDGGYGQTGTVSFEWTLGELATSSYKGASRQFTEGFHQPILQVVLGYDQPMIPKQEDESSQQQISLFPNPTSDDITLQLPPSGTEGYALQILDASGHPILTRTGNEPDTTIHLDVSDLAPGLYFVTVTVPFANLRSIFKVTKI